MRTPLFASQKVLFYRGNMLLASTFLLLLIISLIFSKKIKISYESLFAALVMSASIHLALFVVFPVTFDRSVTMYLLNRLNSSHSPSCQGLAPKQMENLLIDEYVKKDQAISRRIKEQSIINTIQSNNQCVSLTDRGQKFLTFSELIKQLYALE